MHISQHRSFRNPLHHLPRTPVRKAGAVVAAVGVVVGITALSAPQSATAAAAQHGRHLTNKAKNDGLTMSGGGYLGWSTTPTGSTGSTRAGGATASPMAAAAATQVAGIDVSSYQGSVNWAQWWSNGNRFAYVKATEGTYYTNADFTQQYDGSYNQGFIRGSYHFANPSSSGGAAQADYFVAHGGGWSADGKTLPGALDIEYNPYGAECYGLSQASMVSWIKAFVNEYHAKTTRWPVIYSTTDWWSTCTGNSTAFNANDPLWVARYASAVGTLPGAWPYYTFWQNTDSPIDGDLFNGTLSRLSVLATN